ncbi:MFS transporter [Pseudomonas azerbaijanoccidens]|jgi:MFS family permease|uniref:4-hydroxybenzoate transporter PcaK n=1 Tax=Pseudomonas fluorescens TaxID=294 RepID=A0A5E7CVF4_PSEFL|nr:MULTISPECIES: MFS transporter [Pseudomonas]MCK8665348.1 MFS transporter [Pseudomonas azerbaijanoccidentalis]VVO09129.1 4-hydroxybenzoate transporter PcaK [Pseudomonas fluorescens]
MRGETTLKGVDDIAMASSQWRVIGLCMLFNVIDGMDVMAMAFTGSSVSAEWELTGAQLGMLLSASLVGMALGSLLAGPRADHYGRRPLLLAGLSLSGLSMLLSFWSPNQSLLMLLRLLTGIGTGAVLVAANVLTYERASQHRRNLAIALQSMAFALGASLGGVLAHALNTSVGWRYVFLAGGLITLAAGVAGAFFLRESAQFLVLDQQRHQSLSIHPAATSTMPRSKYRALFTPAQWQQTTSLALALLLLMACFYFVMSWTPTLMTLNGFSEKEGAVSGVLLCVGGMSGALLMGLAANRFGCWRLLLGFLLLNSVLMTLIVPAAGLSGLAVTVCVVTGLLLNGAIAGLFTLAPQAFDTAIRTTGVGVVLATGRLGAIISPVVAGVLLDAHWTAQDLFMFFAGSQIVAALLVWYSCRGSKACSSS